MSAARCPMCDTPLAALPAEQRRWRPFCSSRCKLVDLSKWLGEEYAVPGPALGDGGPLGASVQDDAEDQV